MKRLYYSILLICISVITFNCQKEISHSGGNPPGTGNNNFNPITTSLQGNVLNENGQPAINVIIKVGTKTATTNANGYFRINNAALDKETSLVIAEKTGYFKAYRVFAATSGVNQIVIQLLKKSSAGIVNAGTGGTATLPNGSKIIFPSNGIVKASGGAFSGSMNVYAAYIDPTNQSIGETVPGSFLANDKDNKRVILTSFGMMAVELESASGEKLQIASGSTATLTTAIPASLQAAAPATISLWYVDEQTGIWKEEGTATKTGNSYVGEVKHFTYWNCDVSGPTINLTAVFKDPDGIPIPNADITITPVSGPGGSAHGYTDSLGQICGPVPANMNLVLQVMSSCYTAVYSQNIGPFSANTNLGVITVNSSTNIVTVQGRVVNCSGAPVANGAAIFRYNNTVANLSTNANGNFHTSFVICGSSPTNFEIIGVDNVAQQQGAAVNIAVTSTTINTGDITACGTSTLQFANYLVDGTNYSVSSTVAGDQFTGNSWDTAGVLFGAHLSASHGNNLFSFSFDHNGAPGTYAIPGLTIYPLGSCLPAGPLNVVLTSFPATVGNFFEGTILGQVKDLSNVTHTFSCSFRIRRTQ
jgi:hypothetical protein